MIGYFKPLFYNLALKMNIVLATWMIGVNVTCSCLTSDQVCFDFTLYIVPRKIYGFR